MMIMQMQLVLVHSGSWLGKFLSVTDAWTGTQNENIYPFSPFTSPFKNYVLPLVGASPHEPKG